MSIQATFHFQDCEHIESRLVMWNDRENHWDAKSGACVSCRNRSKCPPHTFWHLNLSPAGTEVINERIRAKNEELKAAALANNTSFKEIPEIVSTRPDSEPPTPVRAALRFLSGEFKGWRFRR